MKFNLVSNILFISGLICANVMIILWRRRKVSGARWLSLVMLAMSVWGFAEAFEMASVGFAEKILWAKVGYLGMAAGAPLLLIFSYQHMNSQNKGESSSGKGARITFDRLKPYLWIVPVITVILAWTNEYHHLIWTGFHFEVFNSIEVMVYSHGFWFWVNVTFTYMLLSLSTMMLVVAAYRFRMHYRRQTITLLISIPLPIIANLLYIFWPEYFQGVDMTPVGFAATGIILTIGIYQQHLMDLSPYAREMLMEFLPEAVIVVDDNDRVLDLNPASLRMFGVGHQIEIGDNISRLMKKWLPLEGCPVDKGPLQVVIDQNLILDGEEEEAANTPNRIYDLIVTPFKHHDGCSGKILIFTDISDRVANEDLLFETNEKLNAQLVEIHILKDQIEDMAVRDPLTGLYNRRFLDETFGREFARAGREHYTVSIAMIDVDHFKTYNDTFGHQAGDEVLLRLARHLVNNLREGDVVVRFGGEEFIILLPFIGTDTAGARIDEIRHSFSRIRHREDDIHGVTFSAGIAAFPQNGSTFEEVLKAADEALYDAKLNGRNRISSIESISAQTK